MNNNKKILRQIFKEERSRLSKEQTKEYSESIFNNLKILDIWSKKFYHIYISSKTKREVETKDIIKLLLNKNKIVAVPKIFQRNLKHIEIDQNTKYSINQFGIREPIRTKHIDPSILEVIIVPLLIFDLHGNRVGYGGGYYDRFLTNLDLNVLKVGLSLFDPIDKISDIKDYDMPLDLIVTPKKTYGFSKIR